MSLEMRSCTPSTLRNHSALRTYHSRVVMSDVIVIGMGCDIRNINFIHILINRNSKKNIRGIFLTVVGLTVFKFIGSKEAYRI